MARTALITGVAGQDGSYLAEWLCRQGYAVYGLSRTAPPSDDMPRAAAGRCAVCRGDLSDTARLRELIEHLRPDELYHFGAQSDDPLSFERPEYTADVNGLSTVRLLESIRRISPSTKFLQASSAQLFWPAPPPQREETPMTPRSPYGAAKLFAHHVLRVYRSTYGLRGCSAFLFNHESPRRQERYVTRKITSGLARILAGRQQTIALGNLQARRDWGYAPDYVEAMWRQLQLAEPDDLVIGSGEDHSIGEFVEVACRYAGLQSERCITTDARFVRDVEPWTMRAGCAKAERLLGWRPKLAFEDLVKLMMDADMRAAGLEVIGEGLAAVHRAGLGWSLAGLPELKLR